MEHGGKDILLIEDNMFDAEMTIWMLKKNKIENPVVHISTAPQAMEFLHGTGTYAGRNAGNKPGVILLDLKIGSVSGVKILEEIKSDADLQSIPVIVLSGSHQDDDIAACRNLGAVGYVVKPIEFESFTKDVLLPVLLK